MENEDIFALLCDIVDAWEKEGRKAKKVTQRHIKKAAMFLYAPQKINDKKMNDDN